MAEWEIKRALGECCGTGARIQPGEDYFAALVESADGMERRDYSNEYWESNHPQVYCYWHAKMPEANSKKEIFIDDDMILAFFDRLENETEPEKINFRYVLCLIMMRKKMLRYQSSRILDGHELWTLRVTGTKRDVEVINPELSSEQIEDLTQNIGTILQMDFE